MTEFIFSYKQPIKIWLILILTYVKIFILWQISVITAVKE